MGVYPTGSLVEMTNGAVAIVLEQNLTQRMRPKVMLILDEDKQHLMEYKTVDLATTFEDSSRTCRSIFTEVWILVSYGIDPTEY